MQLLGIEDRIIFDKNNFTLTLVGKTNYKIVLSGGHLCEKKSGLRTKDSIYNYTSYIDLEKIWGLSFEMKCFYPDGSLSFKKMYSEDSLIHLRYYLEDILKNNISGLKNYNYTTPISLDGVTTLDATKLELGSEKDLLIDELDLFSKKDDTFNLLKICIYKKFHFTMELSNLKELLCLRKALDNFFKLFFHKEKIIINTFLRRECNNKKFIDDICIREERTTLNGNYKGQSFLCYFKGDKIDVLEVKLENLPEASKFKNLTFLGKSKIDGKAMFHTEELNVVFFSLDEILYIEPVQFGQLKDLKCTSLEMAALSLFETYILKSKVLIRDFKLYPIESLYNKYYNLLTNVNLSSDFSYSEENLKEIANLIKQKALKF